MCEGSKAIFLQRRPNSGQVEYEWKLTQAPSHGRKPQPQEMPSPAQRVATVQNAQNKGSEDAGKAEGSVRRYSCYGKQQEAPSKTQQN